MKKVMYIMLLLCVSLGTIAVVAPEKLPKSVKNISYKLKALVSDTKLVQSQQEPKKPNNSLYKTKNKDGKITFSDQKSNTAQVHEHSDNAVFINMDSVSAEKENTKVSEGSVAAVLDPVNSINREAEKNVRKMQDAKHKKMEF